MMSSDDGYSEEVSRDSPQADSPSSPSPSEQHVSQLLHTILHSLHCLEHRMSSLEENQKQLMKNHEMLLKTLNVTDSASNGGVDDSRAISHCLAEPLHVAPDHYYTETAKTRQENEIHSLGEHTSLSSMCDDSGFHDNENCHSTIATSIMTPEVIINNRTVTKHSDAETFHHNGYHGEHEPGTDRKVTQQPRLEDDEDTLIKNIEAHIIPETMTEFNKPKVSAASQPSEATKGSDTITRCDPIPSVQPEAAVTRCDPIPSVQPEAAVTRCDPIPSVQPEAAVTRCDPIPSVQPEAAVTRCDPIPSVQPEAAVTRCDPIPSVQPEAAVTRCDPIPSVQPEAAVTRCDPIPSVQPEAAVTRCDPIPSVQPEAAVTRCDPIPSVQPEAAVTRCDPIPSVQPEAAVTRCDPIPSVQTEAAVTRCDPIPSVQPEAAVTRCDPIHSVQPEAAVCAAQCGDLSDTHHTSPTPGVYEPSAGHLRSYKQTEVVEEVIVPCHVQPLGLGRLTQGDTCQTEHVETTGNFTLGVVSERDVAGSVDEVTMRAISMSKIDGLLHGDTEDELDGNNEYMTFSVNEHLSPNEVEQEAETLLKAHWLDLVELDPAHVQHVFTQRYLKPYLGTMSDLLHQILRHQQPHLHQALWGVTAGIAPSVFYKAFGYDPDRQERDFVISEFSSKLKETIKNMKSSQADKIGDRSIQLDTDYIQLRVFGGKRSRARATIPAGMRHISSDDSDSDSDSDTDTVDGSVAAVAEILEEEETEWELPYIHQQRETGGGGQDDIPVMEVLEEGGHVQTGRMVLIKGRPGVGKTTTCQWLYRQWALGQFATRFSMFFVIHIRHLIHIKDHDMSLYGLLSNYCLAVTRAGGLPAYMKPWMEFNEEHILLAIDGIDEMPDFADCLKSPCEVTSLHQHAQPLQIIANILNRSLLPTATVILLSRGFTQLKEIPFDRMMEIKGLSPPGILQFVHNFAPEHRVQDIHNILWRNPLLMSVCTITVYCLLICSALADDITLPGLDLKTYTRIYSFIIMHYLRRSDRPDGVKDSDSIGLRYSSLLTTLASLAQTGFDKRPIKMIFTGFDLQQAEVNLQEVVRTGLMAVDSDVPCDAASHDEQVTTASYLHLSVQEYLASAMVTQLSPEELQRYISTELQRGQFEMALLFCYGQVFDRGSQYVKQVHDAFDSKKKKSVLGFKSTWKPTEEVLINIYKSILESADDSDVYVKMAVLAHESQSPLVAGICADGIMDKSSTMEFSASLMTVVDMMSVMFVVNNSRNLKHLRIQRCGMDVACVHLMEDFLLTTKTLKTLSLPENEIGDDGIEQLCQILKGNKTLKHLCLSYNHVGDGGLEALAVYIEWNNSLQSLELAGNSFSDKGLAALVNAIRKKTSFKTFNICNNPSLTVGCRQHLRLLQNHPPRGFSLRMGRNTAHEGGMESGY